MKIAVKGVHVKENKALEDYALDKAEKFYHFFPEIIKVEIELKTEVARRGKEEDFIADITLHIPGKTLKVADTERDLYKAIDRAVNRMSETLRRHKGKKQGLLNRQVRRLGRVFGYAPELLRSVNKRIFRSG